jgi:hypothetical protein
MAVCHVWQVANGLDIAALECTSKRNTFSTKNAILDLRKNLVLKMKFKSIFI